MATKMWRIALREYSYNFRRPMYILTAFVIPLVLLGVIYLVVSIDANADLSDFENIGYIDLSRERVLAKVAVPPPRFSSFSNVESAHEALEAGEIDAYFVVAQDYFQPESGRIDVYSVDSTPLALNAEIEDFLLAGVVEFRPDHPYLERLQDPVDVETVRILSDDSTYSTVEDLLPRFLVPVIFVLILFMSVNITATLLMSGVVEEKENRMMEVLITSCSPANLLWGKVLGLGAIGLTQIVAWVVMSGTLAVLRSDVNSFFEQSGVSVLDMGMFLLLFLLNYFLFAGLAIGVGASSTAEQEARQFAAIFSFVAILPMLFMIAFFSQDSPVAIVLCLIPFTAPLSLVLGLSFGTLSAWVYVLSVSILILSIFVVMRVSVRVFRLGMLHYGQRLGLRQIIKG